MEEWLKHTKQLWKLRTSALTAILSAPVLVLLQAMTPVSFTHAVILFFVICGLSLGWLVVVVRCPNCDARALLRQVFRDRAVPPSRSGLLKFLVKFLADSAIEMGILTACPKCGYQPEATKGFEDMASRWSRLGR
jgi:predicted RNA-binding Zn-ribbon protein involved in translation (DUF1610 family)